MPGQWVGRGAESLSLHGAPERGQLGTLLEGRNPLTGDELPGGRGRRPTNAGFDLTFTAPKSVSVLLAVGDDELRGKILAAQERAVRAGLDYLELHECFARRGTNGIDVIPAEGFVGGMYTHEMARSGDPHLHTHVVIANRVHAADGRWTAPDMRPVYAAAKTAGTIGEAVLRDELSRSLGVHWDEVRNGTAEIEGVPKEVLHHFSQRHAEILELATTRGWLTERGIEEIQRETRDHKPHLDRDVAQGRWRARAAEHGFGSADLDSLLDRPPRDTGVDLEKLRASLIGPDGLTKQESTFTRRALLQSLAGAYRDGIPAAPLEALADSILIADSVEVSDRAGHQPARYTTQEMLGVEAQLLDTATAQLRTARSVSRSIVDAAIASSPVPLGQDQADAVRHLTSGTERTRLLEARAGYGKTAALSAVADAYTNAGVPVIGTAWQGETAQRLQREAGIECTTTAGLLGSLERGWQAIPDRAVVIVDEASMMPTRPFAQLAEAVAARDGRLILVGDRDQLPPIDAGGAFGSLADRLGASRLEENRRQRDEFQRRIAGLLADGRADDALALLEEHGRFTGYDDVGQARADLIDEWATTSIHHPGGALIIAHDQRDVRALNELARQRLDDAGLLARERLEANRREWAVGDRLICRQNEYDPRINVRNGTRATVVGIHTLTSSLDIRTDDGRSIHLPKRYLAHVEHGYAQTGHASQGATVDHTYVLASPARGGREWGYVAGSRQRIDLRVYAVHHDREEARNELEHTWLRSQAKTLAIDRIDRANLEAVRRRLAEQRERAEQARRERDREQRRFEREQRRHAREIESAREQQARQEAREERRRAREARQREARERDDVPIEDRPSSDLWRARQPDLHERDDLQDPRDPEREIADDDDDDLSL